MYFSSVPIRDDNMKKNQCDVMTANEVAEILRIHPRMVINYAASGEIPAFRVGRRWRFHWADIQAYMKPKRKGKNHA